jgi:hypothetical protein
MSLTGPSKPAVADPGEPLTVPPRREPAPAPAPAREPEREKQPA